MSGSKLFNFILIEIQTCQTNLRESLVSLGQRNVDISMTETTLDTLLQHLGHINLGSEPDDRNRRFSGLGDIKQIIQQSLSRMRHKQIKLIQKDHNGLGCGHIVSISGAEQLFRMR
jgi:hypothetical protein